MQHTSVLVWLGLCALTMPAAAEVMVQGGKTIDCYCTNSSGARVELGDTICLFVNGTMFTAQCQMSLNVPMWRKLRDGCLAADADIAAFPALSLLPDSLPDL